MVGSYPKAFVLKYDLSGNQAWLREFGNRSKSNIDVNGISVTSTGVYVAGFANPLTSQSFTGQVLFAREYDFAGNVVWTSEFSNETSAEVRGVYATTSGVHVVGSSGRVLPGQAQTGAFIVRYDPSGSLVWLHQVGGGVDDVSGDSTGLYLSDGSLRKYDFNGNLVWTAQIPLPDNSGNAKSSVSIDSSGVYVSIATGAGHEFLLKYDLNGGQVWTLQMQTPIDGGTGASYRLSAASGGVFVAGSTQSPSSRSLALVAFVASSSSLVFFGLNPPLSFIIFGSVIAGSVASFLLFRRLRRSRVRRPLVGLGQQLRLPTD
jgi:hypothetical protein